MPTNRLIDEKSPYLLQHAHNPVDWYAWSDAAFELARKENKPIFLSVGYATCHWCHVMEKETFEDQEAAYRESIIPQQVVNRVIIEAASPFGWDRYRSSQGIVICVDDFGKSAPYKVLAEKFGFTKEKVLEKIRSRF